MWCTNTRKIPLGSIVELSITSFNTFNAGNFYHLFHIHGMEFYVMATGHGEYGDNPSTFNSAFRCVGGKCDLDMTSNDLALRWWIGMFYNGTCRQGHDFHEF